MLEIIDDLSPGSVAADKGESGSKWLLTLGDKSPMRAIPEVNVAKRHLLRGALVAAEAATNNKLERSD